MFTIFGKKERYCDGVSRRSFLKVGATVFGGLTMAELLRLEAAAAGGSGSRELGRKAVINIYLGGGPTHMDTFDLKPHAPQEYRGEFRPIATAAPGMEICELMPKLAKVGDKFSLVRSISGLRDEHDQSQSNSGWSFSSLQSIGGRPGVGAVLSKLHGPVHGSAPTFVSFSDFGRPGFLGQIHSSYTPSGEGMANLRLAGGIDSDRLKDRKSLLTTLDGIKRDADQLGMMQAMDSFNERAVNVITSARLADALDIEKEDPRQVGRYGVREGGNYDQNRNFLLARRLVECGVRCVCLSWGGWDTHGQNFESMRQQLPALDTGLSALLEDLDSRGMLEDTMVLMSGEFGRTPRINGGAGRDHWPQASFFFMAGGGLRNGQVVGSTSARGETPKDRPVDVQEVFATVYHQLGIDVNSTTISDPNGRPQYLVDAREPIAELV
jgi:hypothetical protein